MIFRPNSGFAQIWPNFQKLYTCIRDLEVDPELDEISCEKRSKNLYRGLVLSNIRVKFWRFYLGIFSPDLRDIDSSENIRAKFLKIRGKLA